MSISFVNRGSFPTAGPVVGTQSMAATPFAAGAPFGAPLGAGAPFNRFNPQYTTPRYTTPTRASGVFSSTATATFPTSFAGRATPSYPTTMSGGYPTTMSGGYTTSYPQAVGTSQNLSGTYTRIVAPSAAAPRFSGSFFQDVKTAPADPILGLATRFKEDTFAEKVNLGIGAYRTEEGKPWPLPSVMKAQLMVHNDAGEDKEYVPIDGKPEHKKFVQELVFSEETIASKCLATTQAISGTGSLSVVGQFLKEHAGVSTMYMSDPTWGNHGAIFKNIGLTTKTYTYYHPPTRGFDFDGMMRDINKMPAGSAILLHACAHNPTGVDPTAEQWQVIVDTCKEKCLLPVLDNAYQGYASGDLEADNLSVQMFEASGIEFFVCQSFAKNFGLYGERIGYVHAYCRNSDEAAQVLSQLKIVIRQRYSSPPRHGAAIVYRILSNPEVREQWLEELKLMADRIVKMRHLLRHALESRETPGTWNHITDQIGMFSYTGLEIQMCERLVEEFHVYLLKNGRISMAGLNEKNVDYVAECMDRVVRGD